jgi:hypothetical protein
MVTKEPLFRSIISPIFKFIWNQCPKLIHTILLLYVFLYTVKTNYFKIKETVDVKKYIKHYTSYYYLYDVVFIWRPMIG